MGKIQKNHFLVILACPGPNLRSDCANFLLFGHGKICGLWLSTTVVGMQAAGHCILTNEFELGPGGLPSHLLQLHLRYIQVSDTVFRVNLNSKKTIKHERCMFQFQFT